MASITIGDSITPTGVSGSSVADPSQARELTLTNGAKPYDATVSCAASATTTLWTAPTNGVSGTTAAADLVAVWVDPAQTEDTSLAIDIILTYTTVSSTTTTTVAVYHALKREHGVMKFPGEGRLSAGTQVFLTKIEAKNRNSGTSDATNVRVQVWS